MYVDGGKVLTKPAGVYCEYAGYEDVAVGVDAVGCTGDDAEG